MTPIRPNPPQVLPPAAAPRQAEAMRLAAQKAFFEIAAGQAPVTQTSVAAKAAPAPQRLVGAAPQPPTDAPRQPLRPGSLLDIRV